MAKRTRSVARSVIDVMLGEAGGHTPAERWADMIHIASVIQNRATQMRVSTEDVVSAVDKKGYKQFGAYNKPLPAGVGAYRSLAERALSYVEQNGPVTGATFYATPRTIGNLPSGLCRSRRPGFTTTSLTRKSDRC